MIITTKYDITDLVSVNSSEVSIQGEIEGIEVSCNFIEGNLKKKGLLELRGYLEASINGQEQIPSHIQDKLDKLSYFKENSGAKSHVFYRIKGIANLIPENNINKIK